MVDRIGAALDAKMAVAPRHRQGTMAGMLGNGKDIDAGLRQPGAARMPQGVEGHPRQSSQLASLVKAMPEVVRGMQVLANENQAVIESFNAPHSFELGH